jgi:ribose transport system substrate-binding protein
MEDDRQTRRFVIIPKVGHPWFEEVRRGALTQAKLLQEKTGVEISVEYAPPSEADVTLQDSLLAEVAATSPAGILIDPVDDIAKMPAMAAARESGVPVVVFDSPSPDPAYTSVGNDFSEQGRMAARRLVELIGASGEVAIMQGVPTAPNHRQRYEAQLAVLRGHPGITVVEGGVDNDSIEQAKAEAAVVLAARPDLRGYLCCDASGPIGIADAIREAGRVGQVTAVGMDGIEPILEAIKDGVLESSAATIPDMQGSMALLMAWQAAEGIRTPRKIDTGIDLITAANVDDFLAASRRRDGSDHQAG